MPRKEKIREMFDGIAGDYDKLNHIMSLDIDRTWRKRALKRIFRATAAERRRFRTKGNRPAGFPAGILDIACGTGDFSIAIAREMLRRSDSRKVDGGQCRATGHVTGVDLSDGMLGVMREKVEKERLGNIISCETGDCENLRFPDGSFDRVTVAFGVRNFENREIGLKEMLRVLRPGGRMVILELSVPSNAFFRWLFNLYFLHILPVIGGKVSGDKSAYRYLPASVLGFPGRKAFMQTLRDCGFTNVTHKAFTLGICRMYTGEK